MSLDDMLLREEIAKAIESIPLGEENAQLNALGMRMLAAQVARGDANLTWNSVMTQTECFFCDREATHLDVVVNHSDYIVADVCNKHLEMGLSS
jgi:hypothetical protein